MISVKISDFILVAEYLGSMTFNVTMPSNLTVGNYTPTLMYTNAISVISIVANQTNETVSCFNRKTNNSYVTQLIVMPPMTNLTVTFDSFMEENGTWTKYPDDNLNCGQYWARDTSSLVHLAVVGGLNFKQQPFHVFVSSTCPFLAVDDWRYNLHRIHFRFK